MYGRDPLPVSGGCGGSFSESFLERITTVLGSQEIMGMGSIIIAKPQPQRKIKRIKACKQKHSKAANQAEFLAFCGRLEYNFIERNGYASVSLPGNACLRRTL